MAKENEKTNILDMDFGDFITPDANFTNPAVKEEEIKKTKEEEEDEKDTPEEKLDVNTVLEDSIDKKDEKIIEEEEEEIDEEENKKLPGSDDDDSSDEPFTLVLARYQLEQGVLSSLDEEELLKINKEQGPAGAMTYLLKNELENNLESIKEKYDNFNKEYISLREVGYSEEDAGALILNLEELEDIKEEELDLEENESLRRSLIKENYKATTRFPDSKIDRLIKRSFDLSDDIDDAKEALVTLKEVRKDAIKSGKEDKIKEQKDIEVKYAAQLAELNTSIQNKTEIIPGQKLTKAVKDKLIKIITTPVKNDDDGYVMNAIWSKRNEDPIAFDTTLAYLLESGVFDGKWSQIMKSAGTRVTSKLEEQLNETTSTGFLKGGKRTTKIGTEDSDNDMIGPMKQLFS